ncbi:hypothetical protein [Novosphingobium sp.]|uniref:hypothetical protein n=1 Tax=Novosphingobium sp. TaxID=1874826 RepID=UPI003B515FEF
MTAASPESARGRETRLSLAAQFAALACYAGWVIWVGSHHEAWFDEMQAWLLARDNSFGTLIGYYARYEGTPGLWHAVLWVATRVGLPFSDIWMLSAVCAFGGAVVVVRHAPFPLPLRLGLLATYFFGYQYSVVARGYCFDLLLVPIAATLFADRVRRPMGYALVVGVIANINAFSFLAAGLLGLDLFVRLALARRLKLVRGLGDWRAWAALAMVGALGLFSLWTAWQPADNGFMAQVSRMNPVASALVFVANGLFDRVTPWANTHQGGLDAILGMILSWLLLGMMARLVLAGRDRALMLVIPVALIVFSGAVLASSWHGGVLFVFVLFVLWTQWGNPVTPQFRKALLALIALLEVMQGVQTLHSGLPDVAGDYSAGRPAAAGVMAWRAGHPGKAIVAFGGQSFETQPWLPYNVFANYHGGAPHPQFVRWNRDETWHALPHPQEWADLIATRPDAVLAAHVWLPKVVQSDPAGAACRMGYDLVHAYPAAMMWRGIAENNTLYLLERAGSGPCYKAPAA